ncbi:type II toxin-antitoxin system VapC family toxin [Conexibacter sp. CPCC 206217]|uniref:type II toxin-antitoxin system VapC family toxin n=1 Tax=Conexibacter sp. CPCC 206217 TaxID=3064574 RepID=UPI0027219FF3|nr:type II toxin-antitoxin system VapC family toxin [Conexibacter sp. CPCC 206217]MDO8209814.1 type II toxin-antitoxin system VapC family toxin [Conexibacter sp. CPCC 206217]
MILFDVNVLINAHRAGQEHHDIARELVEHVVRGPEPFAVSELVMSGFVRIVTNPRAFAVPTPLDEAFLFVSSIKDHPNARVVRPGGRHWEIFEQLCRSTQARSALIADAHHAALAIEHGCEWLSFDRDFAKFSDLRWRHPLD